MPSTKVILAEQVLYRIYGGVPDTGGPVQEFDVIKALEQKINAHFKLRYFDTLKSGETLPEHAMIATYEGIAVTSFGEKSKATLPITPISLQKNMGIYFVYAPAYPDVAIIPVQRGQRMLMNIDSILNDLSGQFSYEPRDTELIFNKDLTLFGINELSMDLCVMDLSQYGKTDPLPIPADYEEPLVAELTNDFAKVMNPQPSK